MSNNSGAKCGALSITNGRHCNVKIEHSIFINNSAITNSGGVACITHSTISILNSTFSYNKAIESAGVFEVDGSEITIQSSSFDNNEAGINGGVLNSEHFRTSLFISRTSFTNNQGAQQGGVMYLHGEKRE